MDKPLEWDFKPQAPAEWNFKVSGGADRLSIYAADKLIMIFHRDGTITIGEHVKPDEAARQFLAALSELYLLLMAQEHLSIDTH
jgi:hypothetical protein